MRILNKEEFEKERGKLVRKLREKIFIYPTDTVYGIGCNAEDRVAVRKLRSIKEQFTRPLSVIAPGKEWIMENCEVDGEVEWWLEKLPGPYTLILKLKKDTIARSVNLEKDTIGVRIPDHWFSQVVKEMKVPIVTTSANITGETFMTSLENLDEKLKKKVDYIIYDGPIEGTPSTIIDLTQDAKVIRN